MSRKPIIHELKILPSYFDAVVNNTKSFELRKDDRDYQIGDFIILKEYIDGEYTGRETGFKISYILRNCPECGLMDGYCILGWESSKLKKDACTYQGDCGMKKMCDICDYRGLHIEQEL